MLDILQSVTDLEQKLAAVWTTADPNAEDMMG
jgi:hypothetical protein